MATLEQLIIFFLLIGVGVIARKVGVITPGNTPQLTSLVFNFAMPAIILSGITTEQPHISGLLLPLFTTSSWAAEQNSSVHIAPPEATLQCMARRRILSVVSGLIRCSTLTTTSVFPRLMSPLNLVPAPPGIRIQQVSD